MSNTNPVRDNNAIDEIAFAIHFKGNFADGQFVKELIDLAGEVTETLPDYEIINAVTLQLNAAQGTSPANTRPAGIVCYRKSDMVPNRHEWALRVEGNRILVAC